MRFGVVGYGVVGQHMAQDILRAGHECAIYDRYQSAWSEDSRRQAVNESEAVFICVSTPQATDGSCDLSAIEDVFSWLDVPVTIIRSTVPPGTTRDLTERLSGDAGGEDYATVFVPEFIGEGVNPPYVAMRQPPFLIIGGRLNDRQAAAGVLSRIYNSECEFIFTDSTTAELAKYAENYFLALKVTWANELYDIAQCVGADFNQMMSAITHDYRIGRSHTHVYPDKRGWEGRCLPKDLSALLAAAGEETAPLLAALRRVNDQQRAKSATGK